MPAALAGLPYPPPPEARYALYFLVAACCGSGSCERGWRDRAPREAEAGRHPARPALRDRPPGLMEVGAASEKAWRRRCSATPSPRRGRAPPSCSASPPPAARRSGGGGRRAAERKRAIAREQRRGCSASSGWGSLRRGDAWWPSSRRAGPPPGHSSCTRAGAGAGMAVSGRAGRRAPPGQLSDRSCTSSTSARNSSVAEVSSNWTASCPRRPRAWLGSGTRRARPPPRASPAARRSPPRPRRPGAAPRRRERAPAARPARCG